MTCATHIVPQFAPVIDGVGDYALGLARNLRGLHGINSRFIVCDPQWTGSAEVDGFAVAGPGTFRNTGLASALQGSDTAILHYVGYGYHPRGTPVWLADGVEEWKAGGGRRLLTVFHEIWSSGPPWRRVFYSAPLQKRLALRILAASDHAVASTQWAFRLLEGAKPGGVSLLPIPSSLPPPDGPTDRPRTSAPWRPIFFGQAWTRTPAIRLHRPLLRTMHARNLLDRVLVMGKEARGGRAASEDVALLETILPAGQIEVLGERLARDAGLGFNQADFLLSQHKGRDACKSSAVMSAFACGCPAVLADAEEADPLREGEHFLACGGGAAAIDTFLDKLSGRSLPAIAQSARQWHARNADWSIAAAVFAKQLAGARATQPCAAG